MGHRSAESPGRGPASFMGLEVAVFERLSSLRTEFIDALEGACSKERDDDVVHQLRVASRRMREALRVFAPAIKRAKGRQLKRTIGDLATELKDVRDAEVLRECMTRPLAGTSPASAIVLEDLLHEISAGLEHDYHRMPRMLACDAFDSLEDQVLRVLKRIDVSDPCALLRSAAKALDASAESVELAESKLTNGNVEDRNPAHYHLLRITVKRLRYQTECCLVLRPGEDDQVVKTAALWQEALGVIQDLDVLRRFLRRRRKELHPGQYGKRAAAFDELDHQIAQELTLRLTNFDVLRIEQPLVPGTRGLREHLLVEVFKAQEPSSRRLRQDSTSEVVEVLASAPAAFSDPM